MVCEVRGLELFQVLPERFFSVLASPLRELYAGVLLELYQQYLLTSFGIPRPVAVDVITDYLERQGEAAWQRDLEDAMWEEAAEGGDLRQRANFLLRKLEATGWLGLETYSNYQEYVTLADYAIIILEALERVRRNRPAEFQGYVFATYSLLYAEETYSQGSLALEKAYEQTAQLMSGLKSLSHNIKRHTERVLQEKRPQDILRLHFDAYREEILDRNYHRLKTSDNVSRYRPKIVQKINELSYDQAWLAATAQQEVARERAADLEGARAGILAQLDFIRQSYLTMDDLLEEIDRRNSRYAAASLTTLQYMLNTSKDTAGQLLEILKYLADLRRSGAYRKEDQPPAELADLVGLYSLALLDMDSLYTARSLGRRHAPEELRPLAPADPELRARVRRQAEEAMARRLTKKRINEYVLARLGDRDAMHAEELGIENVEDFVKLIYVGAYSQARDVDYRVEFTGEKITSAHSFRFRNVTIRRR